LIFLHKPEKVFFIFLISFLWNTCDCGKILVVPLEGSHWINMDIMIKALHSHGHSITVVRTTKSWYIQGNSEYYNLVTVNVEEAFDHEFMKLILEKIFALERRGGSFTTFAGLQLEMFTAMYNLHGIICKMARSMFTDEDLMKRLNETKYDLVLTDPAWGAGIMLAHFLKIPLVYNVRWITSGEGHLAIAPSPLSYIPMTGSGLSDKMDFLQRFLIDPQYQAVCTEFFGAEIRYRHLLQGADIWLMRVDFVFEFPRPTMPNVVYMGGFQCKPAKPLPPHLENFVQSSGEHGVILMSMGTFVDEVPNDMTDQIAAAFAKLPQKVIWKHKGYRPTTLGNNTLLVDWILFVAHGGTNGIQEAIYHGVPVVGIPLFFDQYDNLLRLKERGGAKILTLSTVDEDNFLNSVKEVLSDQSYRENMQRLSRLHRDQPIHPLDNAIFWIEFVIRHKGAAHLRSESYKMPLCAYNSLDVIIFVLAREGLFDYTKCCINSSL
uniref:UDP-glucuronosyltransferase n=1 Tax=Neogobius melanostomus TaxID=47308 RepID=A0A8C6V071_9GOBI